MTDRPRLRHLVACAACHRQYDASGRAAGSRFHCVCGEVVEVREPRPHESAVVRCSSCGGPRLLGAEACEFCGADFTLHERDLNTICPGCATRISHSARYCHACALPITPQGNAGEPVDASCPACGPKRHLVSRALGSEGLSIMECPRCAGMWLSGATFQALEDGARKRGLSWSPERASPGLDRLEPADGGRLYRPCPTCGKLMNRRNYGRRSGVIVDVCSQHGVWFDLGELSRILAWIRDGGLAHAQEQDLLRLRPEARRPQETYWRGPQTEIEPRRPTLAALLSKALSALLG